MAHLTVFIVLSKFLRIYLLHLRPMPPKLYHQVPMPSVRHYIILILSCLPNQITSFITLAFHRIILLSTYPCVLSSSLYLFIYFTTRTCLSYFLRKYHGTLHTYVSLLRLVQPLPISRGSMTNIQQLI